MLGLLVLSDFIPFANHFGMSCDDYGTAPSEIEMLSERETSTSQYQRQISHE
jgi:hypothetical protein